MPAAPFAACEGRVKYFSLHQPLNYNRRRAKVKGPGGFCADFLRFFEEIRGPSAAVPTTLPHNILPDPWQTLPNYAIIRILLFTESEVPRHAHPAQLLSGRLPLPHRAAGRLFRAARAEYRHPRVSRFRRRDGFLQGRPGRDDACLCHRARHAAARHACGGGQLRQLRRGAGRQLCHNGAPLHPGRTQQPAHCPAQAAAGPGCAYHRLQQQRAPRHGARGRGHRQALRRILHPLFFQRRQPRVPPPRDGAADL